MKSHGKGMVVPRMITVVKIHSVVDEIQKVYTSKLKHEILFKTLRTTLGVSCEVLSSF